jgi:hypothetical protein
VPDIYVTTGKRLPMAFASSRWIPLQSSPRSAWQPGALAWASPIPYVLRAVPCCPTVRDARSDERRPCRLECRDLAKTNSEAAISIGLSISPMAIVTIAPTNSWKW